MANTMVRIILTTALFLTLSTVAAACGDDLTILDPCAECIGQCELDDGFDFDGYDQSCGDGPNLCLSAYAQSDCIEPDFDIVETTVGELHEALEGGEITCEWVVSRHIERTLQYDLRILNGRAPYNAFIALNSAAVDTARRLDDYQRCEGELSGPLHCVPFSIKGNYASTELPTTAGSLGLGEAQAHRDAFTVDRLRRAGAVMMGTNSMDEFAKGLGGYSSRSGKIGNSYDPRRRSGGSSGGSAVAVSTSMAMTSLGTDNCSSLTLPSAYNGLVTIRSTHGLVSTEGTFPLNRLNQTVGPMARTVEDLARMLDVMSQRNPRDPAHCISTPPRPQSYLDHLDPQGLDGKRIGVLRVLTDEASDRRRHPFTGANEQMEARYDEFFAELQSLGATVVDPVELPGVQDRLYSTRNGYDMEQFLAETSGGVSSVEEFCKSERYNFSLYEDAEDCLDSLPQSAENVASRLERGRRAFADNRAYVESVLDELDLDAVVYPTDPRGGARIGGISSNCVLSSYTGLPSITVNAGHDHNDMPFGMMFTGRQYDDPTLFEIAYAYEQGTFHRQAPVLAPIEETAQIEIAEFNALHLDVAEETFQRFLGQQDRWFLTHNDFSAIAEEVLSEKGFASLIQ